MAIMHTIRKKNGKTETLDITRKNAIFKFCIECMGYVSSEVEHCTDSLCPLYPFRNAKAVKKNSTRTKGKKVDEILKKARKSKKKST